MSAALAVPRPASGAHARGDGAHADEVSIQQALRSVVLSPQLAAAASAQRGVFTAAQAYDAGYSAVEIQRLRRDRALLSVRRGVYARTADWQQLDARNRHLAELVALRLVLDEPAVLSHISAGVVHGLSLLSPKLETLHVTRPRLGASRVEAGVHHHAADVREVDVIAIDGWRVTTLARTAIDIARESDLPQAVAALDSVLSMGVPPGQLTETLVSCSNWPGARMASHAVALADGRAANAGESWSRVELTRQGVAPSGLQRKLYDDDGLVGIVDFVWDLQRVVGEFDGRLKYRVDEAATAEDAADIVWSEKRREDRIRALGYEVVRWAFADLYDPARVAARVRRALARGLARGQSPA